MTELLIALLLFPGLLTALGLGLVVGLIVGGPSLLSSLPTDLRSGGQRILGLTIALLAVSSALLPWPGHPAGGSWLWAWVAIELACLLPLIPIIAGNTPLAARNALREAQIGVIGRAVFWLAIGVGFGLGERFDLLSTLLRLAALLGGLLALPAVVGWGRFAPTAGLSGPSERPLAQFARGLRAAVLIAALALAVLPPAQPLISLAAVLAAIIVIGLLAQRSQDTRPQFTLAKALRYNAWRAGIFGILGVLGFLLLSVTFS